MAKTEAVPKWIVNVAKKYDEWLMGTPIRDVENVWASKIAEIIAADSPFREAKELAETFLREFPIRNYSDTKSHELARSLLRKLEE